MSLKSCPFCKGKAIITRDTENQINIDKESGHNLHSIETVYGWIVMCENCCIHTMLWDEREHAIESWNDRRTEAERDFANQKKRNLQLRYTIRNPRRKP